MRKAELAKTKKASIAKAKENLAEKSRLRSAAPYSNQIRNWRIFRGIERIADLAALTKLHDPKGKGFDRVSITRLENCTARYNEDHLIILSKALNVSQRDLVGTNPNDAGDIFAVYAGLSDAKKRRIAKLIGTLKR